MRKIVLFLMLAIILLMGSVVLLAQDDVAQPTAEPLTPWGCPEGFEGQTLSVFNWSTYIADNTISDFEAACSVTVEYSIFESNEAMLARIRQGNPGYDIVVPSGNTIGLMIEGGLLVPLDHSKIPNFKNVSESLLNPPYDPDNLYSIPYQWGTIGIGYNTEKISGIKSWYDVFNHDGKVAWLDDRRAVFGIALNLLGFDPNSTNPDEINAARDLLIENGGNVVSIAADDGQVQLERGDVDMTIEYNGDIINLGYTCECDKFAYTIPEEGSVIWVDNMAIPVDAPNPELAMVFMDYILDPQVGADISNFTAYASPNQASIDAGLIDPVMLTDPGIYPPAEIQEKLFYSLPIGGEFEPLYNNAWDEMLIFLGQ